MRIDLLIARFPNALIRPGDLPPAIAAAPVLTITPARPTE